MLKEAEQGEAIAARAPLAQQADSEPIQPMVLLKRFFLSNWERIPWVAFGAISTGLGVALLFFYFGSIDFVPADIPSILSASLLVAMLAFAFYMWVVISLIAPIAVYRALDLDVERDADTTITPNRVSISGLWALQLLGVGGLLLYVGVLHWLKCTPSFEYVLAAGAVLACLGTIGWWRSEVKMIGRKTAFKTRLGPALFVSLVGTLPFIVLLQVLVMNRGADWPHLFVFFVAWLGVVATSAFLDRIPVWACALFLTTLSPLLVYSLPGLLGFPAFFPTKVAELAGIRSEKVVELRVPESTCELIESALSEAKAVKPVSCNDAATWSTVHAKVLSNLGARWLIELQLAGAQPYGNNGAIRLTIPSEGVHTVRQMPASQSAETAAGCHN